MQSVSQNFHSTSFKYLISAVAVQVKYYFTSPVTQLHRHLKRAGLCNVIENVSNYIGDT